MNKYVFIEVFFSHCINYFLISNLVLGQAPRLKFLAKNGNKGECDEYPYYKTVQGGPKNHPGTVSIRLINQGEGSMQGGVYSSLIVGCKLRSSKRKNKKNRFISVGMPSFPVSITSAMLGICPK